MGRLRGSTALRWIVWSGLCLTLLLLLFLVVRKLFVPQSPGMTLYFPEKNGIFLIPIARSAVQSPLRTSPVTPQQILQELVKGPKDEEHLLPLFPRGAALKEVTIKGSLLEVHFVKGLEEHLEHAPSSQALIVEGMAAALIPFPGLTEVKLYTNGEELSFLKEGAEIPPTLPPVHERWINFNQGETDEENIDDKPTTKRILFFMQKDGPYFIPITRLLPSTPRDLPSTCQEVVQELLRGPRLKWALRSPFPEGAAVQKVTLKGETVRVSFNDIFKENLKDRPDPAREALGCLTLSLTALEKVKDVEVALGSHRLKRLGSLSLSHPLTAASFINTEKERRRP